MKLIHSFDVAELEQLLAQQAEENDNSYLLLDGALNPKVLRRLRASGLPWLSVFTQSDDGVEELMAASPLLAQFEMESFVQLCRLLEFCDGMPMVSVWRTPENLIELAQRLLPWCVVKADDQHFNLRFPDTRRLLDIVGVLSDEQHAQFFGPASLCLLPLREGGWLNLPVPVCEEKPANKVELDQIQTLALIRAGEADETLFQMQFHSHIAPAVLADCYPVAERALQQADREGVDAPDERYMRCMAALRATV